MTAELPDSSFSEPTELSKQWTSIAKLGRLIVAELKLEETNNTLGRWMAYRIAELMTIAENTPDETVREDVRHKCAETITKLWEARVGWSRGNPLANLAEYLQAFKQFNSEYDIRKIPFSDTGTEYVFEEQAYQEGEIEKDETLMRKQIETEINPLFKLLLPRKLGFSAFGEQPPANWLEVFLKVVQSNLAEESVLRDLALAELSLETIQDWLENLADFSSREEREIIEILQKQKADIDLRKFSIGNTTASNFATMSLEERDKLARNVLQKISKEREQLIANFLQRRF